MSPEQPLRSLPSINEVLETVAVRSLGERWAHEWIVAAVREEMADTRTRMAHGKTDGAAGVQAIAGRVVARLERALRPRLREVINATGILLHTNLGRAPVAEEAARAGYQAARGYLNLELDLASGQRSSRQDAVRDWLCRLTGAESATVVNNNAAATIIVLRTVAAGKEVVISRGQLIEIGGSFRIPEIMAVSGAVLREVGCTNITRLTDYETAIGPNTGALLQVHPSNYRISGFSDGVSVDELVNLGRRHSVPVVDDIGSGALLDFERFGFQGEPVARRRVAAGADLVLFSADKLLGGPQAGIIVGGKTWIEKIENDPLMRAFRLDKVTLAALEATLRLYLDERRACAEVPVLQLLGMPLADLGVRAERLAQRLQTVAGLGKVTAAEDAAFVGGGSLPDQALPTWVVRIEPENQTDAELAYRLRVGEPAVVARVRDGKVLLDVRTIFPRQEDPLVAALTRAAT